MGVHVQTLDFFWETIGKDTSLKNVWLLELGNQAMRIDVKKAYGFKTGKSKVYFLNLRCNHHSIDWNGLDGAIPLDMTKPIPILRFLNAFDIITNFGCTEHYGGNHWQAWKNIHDMGRVGCTYIHTVPLWGSHPGHGYYHYTLEFFEKLCKSNEYEVIDSKIMQCAKRNHNRDYVFSSYKKVYNMPFKPINARRLKKWLKIAPIK